MADNRKWVRPPSIRDPGLKLWFQLSQIRILD